MYKTSIKIIMISFYLFLSIQASENQVDQKKIAIKNISRKSMTVIQIRLSNDIIVDQLKYKAIVIFDDLGNSIPISKVGITEKSDYQNPGGPEGEHVSKWIDITTVRPLNETKKYSISIAKIYDGKSYVENYFQRLDLRKGDIQVLDRHLPRRVMIIFPTTMKKEGYKITRKRKGNMEALSASFVVLSGQDDQTMNFTLNSPLEHNDELTISAIDSDGLTLSATKKIEFKRPETRDKATIFAAFSLNGIIDKKDNLILDAKVQPKLDIGSWKLKPQADLNYSTEDSNSRKLLLKLDFERMFLSKSTPSGLIFTIGSAWQADTDLKNQNLLLDLSIEPISLILNRLSPDGGAFLYPAFGIEIGRNLGLADTSLTDLENYSLLRLTGDLQLGYSREFKNQTIINGISVSVAFESRLPLRRELDTEEIPKSMRTEGGSKTRVVKNKDFHFFVKPGLTVKLNEFVAFELTYEFGEQPLLFQNVNKYQGTISYSF